METILDIFTTLNCAIDAGAMTQEALTVALAAIVSRAHEELERGALPLDRNRDWPEKRRDLPSTGKPIVPPRSNLGSDRFSELPSLQGNSASQPRFDTGGTLATGPLC